eukprot:CAMPEP_0175912268 /NCGR_PEP_ID=MMETSP0108-20121206/8632_1 /TAXON_ID=195067 ORGANISM="Goniomonas pacifica, Strain CCMP1869" /NCGR_SAMPLE_ID=MMETSP0108 /ASSEMBLY_ACC=CAM_ASM_000204 /LENGTH=133 /DNA_ID=CAMNT_0017234561 /DNA_START=6 /DNA_END=407 /DNA_ORIENTATION=+
MKLTRQVSSVFYQDLAAAKQFWVDYLQFLVVHEEEQLCVVQRDAVAFHLMVGPNYTKDLEPLVRIETDDIKAVWDDLQKRDAQGKYKHARFPDGPERRPWGAQEFAVGDEKVCLVFQQWESGCGSQPAAAAAE